jgi:hypothetical protein
MEDDAFLAYQEAIDADIDNDPSGRAGISMGFGLAGEFLKRGLLKTVKFKMIVDWESKTYRDRHVFPDPILDEYQYILGSAS